MTRCQQHLPTQTVTRLTTPVGSRCKFGRSIWSTSARVLGESAKAERLGDIPIRAWRDDLTIIRDSLSYVRAILAADVAILTEAGSSATPESPRVADQLAGVLAAVTPDPQWPDQDVLDPDPDIDEGLFVRTDHLLAAHREMARVDLTSSAARSRDPRAGRGSAGHAHRAPGGCRSSSAADQGRHLPALPGRRGARARSDGLSQARGQPPATRTTSRFCRKAGLRR